MTWTDLHVQIQMVAAYQTYVIHLLEISCWIWTGIDGNNIYDNMTSTMFNLEEVLAPLTLK